MKKIVAVVLALVMVLGLSTVAFAAKTTSYEGLYLVQTDKSRDLEDVTLTIYAGSAPKYNKVTTAVETLGVTKYAEINYVMDMGGFALDMTEQYLLVDSLAKADVVLYKDAAYKSPAFYLADMEGYSGAFVDDGVGCDAFGEYYEATPFTNFGEDCGQVEEPADYDVENEYFTLKGMLFNVYQKVDYQTEYAVYYGGEYFFVDFVADTKIPHTAVYENKDGKTVSIVCGECDAVGVEVANKLSLPVGVTEINGALSGVWYWGTAPVAADTDKVESAETFDAGIAMYVGMSVMAAAGSAVVLKKKD